VEMRYLLSWDVTQRSLLVTDVVGYSFGTIVKVQADCMTLVGSIC